MDSVVCSIININGIGNAICLEFFQSDKDNFIILKDYIQKNAFIRTINNPETSSFILSSLDQSTDKSIEDYDLFLEVLTPPSEEVGDIINDMLSEEYVNYVVRLSGIDHFDKFTELLTEFSEKAESDQVGFNIDVRDMFAFTVRQDEYIFSTNMDFSAFL